MYSIFEIAFFILYFLIKLAKFTAILLLIQIVVFRITGISLYKKALKATEKLIMEDF